MAEIIVSSSSDRDDRKIDEYHDNSNSSGSSSESSSSDERYSFGTLEIPLDVFQEEMRKRVASDCLPNYLLLLHHPPHLLLIRWTMCWNVVP